MNRRDAAVRYCLLYTGRYLLSMAGIVLVILYVMSIISSAMHVNPLDILSRSPSLIYKFVLTLLPMIALSFMIGWYDVGSRNRLVLRLVINVYVIVLMLVFSANPSFAVSDIHVNDVLTVVNLNLRISALPIAIYLMIIPVCSIIDSWVEYRQQVAEDYTC